MLAACGGGGEVASTAIDVGEAAAAADIGQQAFKFPVVVHGHHRAQWGNGFEKVYYTTSGESTGRLIDLKGRFIANFHAPINAPPAAGIAGGESINFPEGADSSSVLGLTPNGLAVGWLWGFNEIQRGFVVLDSAGPRLLPDHTRAQFISESGLVGGHVCPPRPNAWRRFTGVPKTRCRPCIQLQAAWMNNPGTMFGHHEPAGGLRQLATVDRDGPVTPVPFDTGPGVSATPLYIADDGSLFINTRQGQDVPGGDAIVISNGATEPIGRGIAPRPELCTRVDCVESAAFTAFSAAGHAVGVNTLHYLDANLGWQVASTAGFHWTAKDGAIVIKGRRVGRDSACSQLARRRRGCSGGRAGGVGPNEPFIWHRAAGGVLLRQLLHIGPDLRSSSREGSGTRDTCSCMWPLPASRLMSLVLYAPDPDICLP